MSTALCPRLTGSAKSTRETLLRYIFGILPVIRNALRQGANFLLITKKQFLESLSVPALCGSHQRVGVFAYAA
jgi:hypothetical protein